MPSCDLALPEMGASVPAGDLVIFEGTASDPDVPSDWLTVTFDSNVDGYLGAVSASSAGNFAFATSALTATTHTVTMTVTDEVGGSCSDFTLVTVSNPPDVEITAPSNGAMFNEFETISFYGEAHDTEEPDSSLLISWSSDLVGSLGGSSPDSSGFVALNTPVLVPGNHLVTLSATNSSGLTGTDTISLSVNQVPTQPTVSLTPLLPTTLDDLVVSIDVPSSDSDGPNPVSYSYSWTQDGNPQPAYSGLSTVPSSATAAGEIWAVTVTGEDGFAVSPPGLSSTTIENSAPTITTVTLGPTIGLSTDTYSLTIVGWMDVDGDPPGYTYQWYAGAFPISGETSPTLVPSGQSAGTVLYCEVTPFDGQSPGPPVTSTTAVINTPPTAPVVSISPASPGANDDLTAMIDVPSVDVDGGPSAITYNYAWSIDGNPQPAWNGIATIPAAATFADEQWSVGVTASDGLEDSTTASATATVTNSAPSITGATVAPPVGLGSTTFTVTPSGWFDADGDPPGYLYQWYAGTTLMPGATLASWVPVGQPAGTSIWVEVTPWDGTPGLPVIGTAVINTPPIVSGVSISPTTATESSTLTASYSTATDADGQPVGVSWQWYEGANPIAGAVGASLTGANFGRFDQITVHAIPNDGLENGAEGVSNTVTISNTAPETSSPTIDQSALYTNTPASCSGAVGTDIDGDPVTITYSWLVNFVDLGVSGSSLSASTFSAGDLVQCVATPSDGDMSGTPQTSVGVTVLNTAPSITSATVSPPVGLHSTTFTVSPSGWVDPDGDPPSFLYQWYAGTTLVPGATLSSWVPVGQPAGTPILVEVTPWDGAPGVPVIGSAAINTPPVVSGVSISPTTATESSTLMASYATTSDVDGQTVGVSWQWYEGTNPIAGAVGPTLTGASFDRFDQISVQAIPNDGLESGSAGVSNTVTISNTPPETSAPTIDQSTLYTDTNATCSGAVGTDVDGDPVAIIYSWLVNFVDPGVTGSSLSASAFVAGDLVECVATPNDGNMNGTGQTSTGITVSNSSPSVTAAGVSPSVGLHSTTFTVTPSGWVDPDGDPPSYLYQWYAGTTLVPGATLASWIPVGQPAGTSIWVEVTPWDGTPGLPVVGTAAINTPPVVSGVAISPTTADESTTLLASYAATSDVDGQTVTVSWQWYEGINPIAGAVGSSLTGASFDRFDQISVQATPNDSLENGSTAVSNTVTISNTPPETSNPTIDQITLYTNTAATCSGAVGSDLDGDAVTITYSWLVNSSDPGVTGPGLSPSAFTAGDLVQCVATPDDGNIVGQAATSAVLSVQNSPPTAPVVLVSPAYPTPVHDLECSIYAASTDADGDSLTYDIEWLQNGLPSAWGQSGAALNAVVTVPNSVTAGGDVWTCEISAWDGQVSGPAGTADLEIDRCLSLDFDGSSDVVTVASFDATSSGAFTTEAWVFWPGTSLGDDEVVAAQFSGPTERWRAFIVNQDTGGACSGDSGSLVLEAGSSCVVSTFGMAPGFWHHLAWVWNGGSVSLFIDGQPAGTGSLSISGLSSDDLSLGAAGVLDGLQGGLDEVRISSIQRYSSPFIPEVRYLDDLSTLGLWHFEEAMGNVAGDSSSNGADGIISGALWATTSVCDAEPCDIDGDGSDRPLCGGGDCDDSNPAFGPFATDTVGDGIDHNCDGMDCEGTMIGSNYFNVCSSNVGWYAAQAECVAGGYTALASIGDASEQAGLDALTLALGPPYDHYWIGLNDQQVEGTFEWVDGDPMNYTNWMVGEPNAASTSEDCVHIWKMDALSIGGQWNDNECTYQLSYICSY